MIGKIAYIMSRFPKLSETFILREMNELKRLGWVISLYPLIKESETIIHPEAEPWIDQAHFFPYYSLSILVANARCFFSDPIMYLKVFIQTIVENFRSVDYLIKALLLFPKSVKMAEDIQLELVDHIHAHYASHPALVAWIIHKFTGIAFSITVHAHDIFVDQVMLETKISDAISVVSISEYNCRFLENIMGQGIREKINIIHCGIQPSLYADYDNSFGSSNVFKIINVGSLQDYKGQIYLLEACKMLKKREIQFQCCIIGEGEERPHLEKMIKIFDLDDQVLLLGAMPQAQVAQFLTTGNCYVQPSIVTPSGKMEGIPVAIMEAFAAGLPVVATNLSGIPELVQPDKSGFLVPPADAMALANAIEAVMVDLSDAKILAEKGRSIVLDEFDLEKNALLLSKMFTRLVVQK